MVSKDPKTKPKGMRFQRTRHAVMAGAIALVLSVLMIFEPVDQLIWTAQARATSEQASGDIVYIGAQSDLADPTFPERRRNLAALLDRLDEADVERVYIDVVFEHRTESDALLNDALQNFSGQSYLVASIVSNLNGERQLKRSVSEVSAGIGEVGVDSWTNFLGFVWSQPYDVRFEDEVLPSLASHIAGVRSHENSSFPINYNFELGSIPAYQFEPMATGEVDVSQLAGKTVVIGDRVDGELAKIPGQTGVSPSLVEIFAAETLKAGTTQMVLGFSGLIATLIALLLATMVRNRTRRRVLYALVVIAVPIALAFGAQYSIRAYSSDAITMLAVFAIFRWRAHLAEQYRLVDPETHLPTFVALEADNEVAQTVPAIIVAKIHRFEEVRRSLPKELHAEYVLRISNRLKAATQDATIYLGPGHLIAWTMAEKDPALLREHLEGLRALFSSPLVVGNQQVDVGITFGVDISPSPNVARRLASGIAVAEQTNETYEPIAIADTTSEEDLIWNISLQARIDAALANGEIYLAFQPKVLVQSGEMIGVEALVRWNDPAKGQIPPDNFIRQCETAGRMSQLTRYVLEQACLAGNRFDDAGLNLPVAVNISATLVHERSIVRMISEVLDQTGFEPRRLTLEITETYRLSNIERAAEILGQLEALGCKISMDDFGVGAASLEALLRLPFHELKIDRLFTSQVTSNPKAEGIVKSILDLGKSLRIIVVAEGVEDAGTLTKLRELGCVVAQGFGISRPVDQESIIVNQGDSKTNLLQNMV